MCEGEEDSARSTMIPLLSRPLERLLDDDDDDANEEEEEGVEVEEEGVGGGGRLDGRGGGGGGGGPADVVGGRVTVAGVDEDKLEDTVEPER